uniref:Uncharacterized protein n=1 Tax=Mustela putorius furo TaxID=9669 RepID=M3Z7N7_MUSPF
MEAKAAAGRPLAGAPAVRGKAEATHLTVRRTGGTPRGGPGPGDPCLPGHARQQGVVAPAQLRTPTFSPALLSGAAPPRSAQGRGGESQPEGDWEPFQAPLDTCTPNSSASPLLPHPTPPRPLLGYPGVLRPGLFLVPLPRPKRPSPALPVLRLGRPDPCAEMGFPLSDALAAPRYLFLGSPRCSGSPRSPRGSSGPPPLPGQGRGGPLRPVAQLDFPTQTPPPVRPSHAPFPVVPPLRARESLSRAPPRLLRVPLASALVRRRMPDAGCRVRGATYRVQPRAPPDKPLFHSDHAPFRSKPRPTCSGPAPKFSPSRFRSHRPAPRSRPRPLPLLASYFPSSFPIL